MMNILNKTHSSCLFQPLIFSLPKSKNIGTKKQINLHQSYKNIKLNASEMKSETQKSSPVVTKPDTLSKDEDVQGEVITPSIFNNTWVRILAVIIPLAATIRTTNPDILTTNAISHYIHLLSFSAFFGSTVYGILLTPKVMFNSLGRKTFGRLQSKLFPLYFGFSSTMLITSLATMQFEKFPISLSISLVTTLANLLIIEPYITKRIMKRYALEEADVRDEEKIAALKKESSKYHGISSLLALIALSSAFTHGWWLSSKLIF